MARPSKLTPETRTKLLQAFRMGASYAIAARFAGIHPETLRLWLRQGEQDEAEGTDSEFSAFFGHLKTVEAEAGLIWLSKIEQAPQWTAAAWKLERRFPVDYGRQSQQRASGETEGPKVTSGAGEQATAEMTEDELAAEVERLRRQLGIEG